MQRYDTKVISLTSLGDWQPIYEDALEQLSTLYQTEKIAPIQYRTFSDFLEELNQGLQYIFKLTSLAQKTGQLRSLSKKLENFLKEQSHKSALGVLSPLSLMLNTAEQQLLNLKNLPPEILQFIANEFLDSQATLRLASTCRDLFFSDAGLVTTGITKGFKELGEMSLEISQGQSNYVLTQGTIFAWGINNRGELGLEDEVHRLNPAIFDLTRLNLASNDRPKSIFTFSHYSFLLSQRGRCFAWGYDVLGNLSAGHFAHFSEKSGPMECDLSLLNLDEDDEIESIFPGGLRAFIYTKRGRLFAWGHNILGALGLGDNENKLDPVEFDLSRLQLAEHDKVRSVILSNDHTLLLTEQGRCYAWGRNSIGQLGLGDTVDRNSPVEINLYPLNLAPHDKVVSIVTSYEDNFRFLLTQQGRLFAWGRNQGEWLRLGEEGSTLPVEIDLSSLQLALDDKVKTISCGYTFLLLLTEQGHGFAWGANYNGQLGLGDMRSRNQPTKIDFTRLRLAPTDKISAVAAGANNAFWSSGHGRHFVCGRNDGGRLGLGDNEHRTRLVELSLPMSRPLQKLTALLLDKEHLDQLAHLAQSKERYGRRCFQLLLSHLPSIDDISIRIFYLSALMTSPWNQSEALAKYLPLPTLYQPLLDVLKNDPNSRTLDMTKILSEFISCSRGFATLDENKKHEKPFLDLLTQLNQGEIKIYDDFKNHVDKLVKDDVKFAGMTLFEATQPSAPSISAVSMATPYLDVCQQWLTRIEKDPALLAYFQTAAEIFLQAIRPTLVPQLTPTMNQNQNQD